MYRLFYNHKDIDDKLEIVLSDLDISSSEELGDVTYYYHDDKVTKIAIKNISDYLKIKTNDMIINPIKDIIKLINLILESNGNKYQIEYKNQSGFIIGHILEKDNNFYQVDIGKVITIISDIDINLDSYVVVSEIGSISIDKKVVRKYEVLTSKDLGLDDKNDIIYVEKDTPGKDYFLNEGE